MSRLAAPQRPQCRRGAAPGERLTMRPTHFRWVLPALLVAFTVVARADAQPPNPFLPGFWWRDFQKVLGLSTDQSGRIESIFQAALPRLRHKRDQLVLEEGELSRLIKADSDDTSIAQQSDRVEAVRTVLNKERTLMLVHMRAVLTSEQRIKLNTLREHWDQDHKPQRPR